MSSLADIESRVADAVSRISNASDEVSLRAIQSEALSAAGWLSDAMKRIREVPADEKKAYGQAINAAKSRIEKAFESRLAEIKSLASAAKEYLDVTLESAPALAGRLHPTTQALNKVCGIFIAMGFEVVDGPEIEDEYHNFDALNITPDHPARDNMDTFFIHGDVILRTHTSPVQIRTMERIEKGDDLLIRIISPGVTYRRDRADRTHTPVFSQVEGLMVGRGIKFAHMAGILREFARQFFGPSANLRLRPDFFPFVEPGAEAAVTCPICGGGGCPTCKRTGWVEIMGCGMVHPAVLDRQGIPSDSYQGFAFGMGIERLTQMLYQVEDSRWFFENDVRFLRQF
ncbi:MAG: phenylalanine--tRNA ligase subunit alpha [bacterium]